MSPRGTAEFDPTGRYRYRLSRWWDEEGAAIAFLMLNPSRADGSQNDPTIRRCMGLAQAWGYGQIQVINLFAYRAPYPSALWQAQDPVGPENDYYLHSTSQAVERIVLAWGNWGNRFQRDQAVCALLWDYRSKWCHLGLNQTGQPRHPLYVPRGRVPIPWSSISL